MNCRDCELLLAEGLRDPGVEAHLRECAECRFLAGELSGNASALSALKDEELPKLIVRIPRRAPVYAALATVAAAAFAIGMLWPRPPVPAPPVVSAPAPEPAPVQVAEEPPPAVRPLPVNARPTKTEPLKISEPLKIKMLTPDPDVVIYWLVDN